MSNSGGRRVATASGSHRLGVGAVVAFVLFAVAVLVVVLVGPGRPVETGGETTRPSGVPVDDRVVACPRAPAPPGVGSRVLAGSAPLDGLGSGGSLRQGPLGADADGPDRQPERGRLTNTQTGADDRPAVVVDADGEIAAGLFAHQVDADARALAVADCAPPAASWWFAGAGATVDHSSELVMSNVDPGPAVVDVRVFGPDGEIETIGTRGITIPPAEQITIAMADVAPQSDELTVSVEASRGRVVAAVADSYASRPSASGGTEWLPAQADARRVLELAPLPTRADARTLLVTNPSEQSEALVELELVGENGTFAPAETSEIRVPPGSVVSTDISKVIAREDVAVRLRSQLAVVATVRSTNATDVAYAGGVRRLTAPAVAPLVDDADSRVLLSAGDEAARATVTTYTADGRQVESAEVAVPATATKGYQPTKRAAYLVVTPQQGAIFGGVSVTGAAGVSQVPLLSLSIRNPQPVVRPVIR